MNAPPPAAERPAGPAERPGRLRQLLLCAGALHLLLALVLQLLGRAGWAPALAGPSGFSPALAHDASIFQFNSAWLVGALRHEGLGAWLATAAPLHAKLYSLSYHVAAPWVGYGVLGAEPLNLLFYLATLTLVFQIARALAGPRAGLLAAAAVGLWPSYLLLSVQILRDPPFIAGLLLLCRAGVALLAEEVRALRALLLGGCAGLALVALWLMRWDMQELCAAAALLPAGLLLLRRPLRRGALLGAALLAGITLAAPRLVEATRPAGVFPHRVPGLALAPLDSVVSTRCEPRAPWTCLHDAAARVAWRAGFLRDKFLRKYGQAGSNLDADVRLQGIGGLARYLPRALSIGLLSPFPRTWLAPGNRVGRAGRLLSGLEMLPLYAAELLALVGLLRRPTLPGLYLALIALAGCAALGAVVLNVGTLYRLRYPFAMLIVTLASAACSRTRSGRSWDRPGTPGSAA